MDFLGASLNDHSVLFVPFLWLAFSLPFVAIPSQKLAVLSQIGIDRR